MKKQRLFERIRLFEELYVIISWMKYILLILFTSTTLAFSCEENNKNIQLPLSLAQFYVKQISPVIKTFVTEEAGKELKKHSTELLKYSMVEAKGKDVTVFGFTEREIMNAVDDPNNRACSTQHIHDDLANRWCHGSVVKMIDETLKSKGLNKFASALLSASIFVPKEYLIDLHPSRSDLVISDFEIYKIQDSKGMTKSTVTIFGDGMAFVTLEKNF